MMGGAAARVGRGKVGRREKKARESWPSTLSGRENLGRRLLGGEPAACSRRRGGG